MSSPLSPSAMNQVCSSKQVRLGILGCSPVELGSEARSSRPELEAAFEQPRLTAIELILEDGREGLEKGEVRTCDSMMRFPAWRACRTAQLL